MASPTPIYFTYLSIIIASVALLISIATLWLSYFRKGRVRMTRPAVIYFGSDGLRSEGLTGTPKIFLRTLLISDSKRGRILENLYVTLTYQEIRQTFNIWVYGDEKLLRGSGLYVSDAGVVTNHHFFLPSGQTDFQFRKGTYTVEVYAKILGNKKPTKLISENLAIDHQEAEILLRGTSGIYFDWGPQSDKYTSHITTSNLDSSQLQKL